MTPAEEIEYRKGRRLFFSGEPPGMAAFYWDEGVKRFRPIRGRTQLELLQMAWSEACRMCDRVSSCSRSSVDRAPAS